MFIKDISKLSFVLDLIRVGDSGSIPQLGHFVPSKIELFKVFVWRVQLKQFKMFNCF